MFPDMTSPRVEVFTKFPPSPEISDVLYPSKSTLSTALSTAVASSSNPNESLSIMAVLNIEPIGFAMPLPVMSGALPCMGS